MFEMLGTTEQKMIMSSSPPDMSVPEECHSSLSEESDKAQSLNKDKKASDVLYFNGSPLRDTKGASPNDAKQNQQLVLSNISKELYETDICPNVLSSHGEASEKDICSNEDFKIKTNGITHSLSDKVITQSTDYSQTVINSEIMQNGLTESSNISPPDESTCDSQIAVINKLESAVNNYNFQIDKTDFESKLKSVSKEVNESSNGDDMVNGLCDNKTDCDLQENSESNNGSNNVQEADPDYHECDNLDGVDEIYKVPKTPIFNGSYNFKVRGSLKRKSEDSGNDENRKKKRTIKFDNVTVFYFPRSQGFNCVPSQGGSTLGMSRRHFSIKSFSLSEHAAEQRKFHKDYLMKLRQRRNKKTESGSHCSSSEESDENSEEASDISDSELEADSFFFLQPLPIRKRRALLRQSGIRQIECLEKDDCKTIRNSRELCGCQCKVYCDPSTCQCSLAGIKCQVDRHNFPCGCSRDGCNNTNGRIEFNPIRVRTHFLHTLMRLEIEKCQSQCQQQWELQHQIQQNPQQNGRVGEGGISSDTLSPIGGESSRSGGLSPWLPNATGSNASTGFGSSASGMSNLPYFSSQDSTMQVNHGASNEMHPCASSMSGIYSSYDTRQSETNLGSNNELIFSQGNVGNFGAAGNSSCSMFSEAIFSPFDAAVSPSFLPTYGTTSPSSHFHSPHADGFPTSTTPFSPSKISSSVCPHPSFQNSFYSASCMQFNKFSTSPGVYQQNFSSCLGSVSNVPHLSIGKVSSFSLADVLSDIGGEATCVGQAESSTSCSQQFTGNCGLSPLHSLPQCSTSDNTTNHPDCLLSRPVNSHSILGSDSNCNFPLNGSGSLTADMDSLTNSLLKPNNNSILPIMPSSTYPVPVSACDSNSPSLLIGAQVADSSQHTPGNGYNQNSLAQAGSAQQTPASTIEEHTTKESGKTVKSSLNEANLENNETKSKPIGNKDISVCSNINSTIISALQSDGSLLNNLIKTDNLDDSVIGSSSDCTLTTQGNCSDKLPQGSAILDPKETNITAKNFNIGKMSSKDELKNAQSDVNEKSTDVSATKDFMNSASVNHSSTIEGIKEKYSECNTASSSANNIIHKEAHNSSCTDNKSSNKESPLKKDTQEHKIVKSGVPDEKKVTALDSANILSSESVISNEEKTEKRKAAQVTSKINVEAAKTTSN